MVKGDYLAVFEPQVDGVEEEPNHKISETSFNIESSQISLIVYLCYNYFFSVSTQISVATSNTATRKQNQYEKAWDNAIMKIHIKLIGWGGL